MDQHCNDENILQGLCKGGRAMVEALKCLENECKPQIVSWLTQRGIPAVDANIIWNETVEAAWENLCLKEKPLTTKLCHYLKAIAHNKWKKYWQKRGVEVKDDEEQSPDSFEASGLSKKNSKEKKYTSRHKQLSDVIIPPEEQEDSPIPKDIQEACWEKLSPKAREIISASLDGYTNEEMALKFGYLDKNEPAKPDLGTFKTIKSRHWTRYISCIRLQITKRNCFAKLPFRCQTLLKDRRNQLSWESIVQKLGISNVETAKEEHQQCSERFDACVEAGMEKFFALDCYEKLDDKPKALVRDFRKGLSLEDLAEKHGFSATTEVEVELRAHLQKLEKCQAQKLSKFKKNHER